MEDKSFLNKKYFIDEEVYNCPFCNRRNVIYKRRFMGEFDWSEYKTCYIYTAVCSSCKKISMHLSFESDIFEHVDIDSKIFYSRPTSFFVMDKRIPTIIRELVTEADGCLKMNFLTGASACMRKAIYEFTIIEEAKGEDYETKIKFLKSKHQSVDSTLFDILVAIKDMTSDKIHEQSWDEWDSDNLNLIIETLKTILHEIYVLPKKKEEKLREVQQLREKVQKKKSKAS